MLEPSQRRLLCQQIQQHLKQQLQHVGLFMPEDTLVALNHSSTTVEDLLQLLLERHETAVSMLSTTGTRLKNITTLRARLEQVIRQIKTVQASLDNAACNSSQQVQALMGLLPHAWAIVEKGIHEESLPQLANISSLINEKISDPVARQTLSKTMARLQCFSAVFYDTYPKDKPHFTDNKILYFLIHYIASDKIENCFKQQQLMFDVFKENLNDVLMTKFGENFKAVYRQMQLMILLNRWLAVFPNISSDCFSLTQTKMQYLSHFLTDQQENDFFTLMKLYDFYRQHSTLSNMQLLEKLQQDVHTTRIWICRAETRIQPDWSSTARSFGTQACYSFYYIEIMSALMINAVQELSTFSNLPLSDLYYHNTVSLVKNTSRVILALLLMSLTVALLLMSFSQDPRFLAFITAQSLNKLLCSQFNALLPMANTCRGDEISVLRYSSIAQHVLRYILFMSLSIALSGVGGLVAAHFVYGFFELMQYSHNKNMAPHFTRLQQQYPDYQNVLSMLNISILLLSFVLGNFALDNILTQLHALYIEYIQPAQPPSCNPNQALADLGLSTSSNSTDICNAWRQSHRFHPDINKTPGAATIFQKRSTAFNCLVDHKIATKNCVSTRRQGYRFKDL